jgi:hypothetical protein
LIFDCLFERYLKDTGQKAILSIKVLVCLEVTVTGILRMLEVTVTSETTSLFMMLRTLTQELPNGRY